MTHFLRRDQGTAELVPDRGVHLALKQLRYELDKMWRDQTISCAQRMRRGSRRRERVYRGAR